MVASVLIFSVLVTGPKMFNYFFRCRFREGFQNFRSKVPIELILFPHLRKNQNHSFQLWHLRMFIRPTVLLFLDAQRLPIQGTDWYLNVFFNIGPWCCITFLEGYDRFWFYCIFINKFFKNSQEYVQFHPLLAAPINDVHSFTNK